MRDPGHADFWIGEHRLRGLDLVRRQSRRASSSAANAARGSKPSLGALADQAALELRQRAEHGKDKSPSRRRRVDGFRQPAKTDAAQAQHLGGLDQLLDGTSWPVELPDNKGVALARLFQRLGELEAVSDRA